MSTKIYLQYKVSIFLCKIVFLRVNSPPSHLRSEQIRIFKPTKDLDTAPAGHGRHLSSTGGALDFTSRFFERRRAVRRAHHRADHSLSCIRHRKRAQRPDSGRKRHVRATPLVGGLAIMTSVLLSTAVPLMGERSPGMTLSLAVLLCGCGSTLVGYADDQSSTSPSSRLLLLFLLSGFLLSSVRNCCQQ